MDENKEVKRLVTKALESKTAVGILNAIYAASYFRRAWNLQEIILGGSRGIVVWGTLSCDWEAFKKALLVFALHTTWTHDRTFMDIVQLDSEFSMYGEIELVRIIAALARFQATDARDKVFAALRLGSTTTAHRNRKPPVATNSASKMHISRQLATLSMPRRWCRGLSETALVRRLLPGCRHGPQTSRCLQQHQA